MNPVQVRPALAIDLIVEIRAFDRDVFNGDFAARIQRERVADLDQRVQFLNRGHDLVCLLVVYFQTSQPRRLRVPAYAEAADLRPQSEFAEFGFDLSGDVFVETLGSNVYPDGECEGPYNQGQGRDCEDNTL